MDTQKYLDAAETLLGFSGRWMVGWMLCRMPAAIPAPKEADPKMNQTEVCEYLGSRYQGAKRLCPKTLRKMIRANEFPAGTKDGNQVWWYRSVVDQWVDDQWHP